jgi:hypothetical protein
MPNHRCIVRLPDVCPFFFLPNEGDVSAGDVEVEPPPAGDAIQAKC